MDMAKAKSVIIALLFAFNLFLLFSILTYFKGQGIQIETIKNAEAILKARGVTLECSIPRTSKAVRRLEFGNGRLDREAIAAKLLGGAYAAADEAAVFEDAGKKLEFRSGTEFVFIDDKADSEIMADSDGEVKKAAREYLKDKGLINGKYVVDDLKRSKDGSVAVTFVESYDGFLVFDNYCIVTVTAGGITRLEYGRLQITGFSAGKVEDPATAYQVLLAHFKEGGGQVITSIDNGYKYPEDYPMEAMESVELLPVWRVKIKGASAPEYLGTIDTEE